MTYLHRRVSEIFYSVLTHKCVFNLQLKESWLDMICTCFFFNVALAILIHTYDSNIVGERNKTGFLSKEVCGVANCPVLAYICTFYSMIFYLELHLVHSKNI